MDSKYPAELVIIAGEQLGARASLDNNYTVTLSGESDTDLLLRDASIDKERLKITTKNNKAYIEAIAGHIEIEGKPLVSGKKTRLNEYAKVKIGNTVFIYTKEPSVSWEYIQNKVKIESSKSNQHGYKQNIHITRNNLYFIVSIMIIVFVIILSATSINQNNMSMSMSSEDILHMLRENGYGSLKVSQKESGQLSIIGFVMSYKDRAVLEKLVDDNNIPAILDLNIGDQLALEVRELFRINNVEVNVTVTQEGKVNVVGKQRNAEEMDRIKSIALSEITDLKSINLELTESSEDKQIIGADISYNDADKRITMVVDGDPAYIMTLDQSKYYVGALLPTGHKIIDIVDNQVILEKQGKRKALDF